MILTKNQTNKIFIVLAILFIIYMIWALKEGLAIVATPFITALIITYLTRPLINLLHKTGINFSISVVISFFITLALFVAGLFLLIPQILQGIQSIIDKLPEIVSKTTQGFQYFLTALENVGLPQDIKQALINEANKFSSQLPNFAGVFTKNISGILFDVVGVFGNFLIGFLISYYYFVDYEKIRNTFLKLFPKTIRTDLCIVGSGIDNALKGFIQGQLLAALIVGTMEWIGLSLLGVNNALALAVIGGIANLIPFFGPFIGAIPAIAVGFLQSPIHAVSALIVFLFVQQIDNMFVSPKIIEGRLGLHPLVTLFAVLFGGSFFGIEGMFFAVPVVAIIWVILNRIYFIFEKSRS